MSSFTMIQKVLMIFIIAFIVLTMAQYNKLPALEEKTGMGKSKVIEAVKEIKSGLEIEKQKMAKTVILDDVDRYRVMEASFEGIRVILSYRGEKYSPEYIQGISGAAFRIAGICPCAPTCSGAMNTQDLPKLFGYEVNYISLNQEGIDPKTQVNDVVALVKDEIRTGRPALVWNAFTNAEWDVVCGFDDEKKQFIGRGSYAGMEKYATVDDTRMTTFNPALGVIIIGDKTGEFKANEAELSALKEAVRHAHTEKEIHSDGKWVFLEGLQCYDRWVNEFKSDPNKKRGSGDSYCLGIYRSTHRAASGFMKELASKYPETASNFEKAAMYFSSEADALDKCDPLLGWNAPEGLDAERNNKAAELLSQARDNYAKGIGEIEQAIKLIESNAIPEPKIIQKEAFFIAGLRYEGKNEQGEIPAMWHDFAQRIGEIGIDISKPFVAYGVSRGIPNAASGVFEYLAAVEVKSIADLPQRMVGWEIPALAYAVFSVNGIPDIGRTFTLFNKWVPQSKEFEPTDGPLFELYPETFDQDSILYIYFPVRHK